MSLWKVHKGNFRTRWRQTSVGLNLYVCMHGPPPICIQGNRWRDCAIANLLFSTASHVNRGEGNYVEMLFTDSSSAFNIIVPPCLSNKTKLLRINTHICNWVLSLLSTQVHMWVSAPGGEGGGGLTSKPLTFSTGLTQRWILGLLLFNINASIIKFTDDIVVILGCNQQAYLDRVADLVLWCQSNNLVCMTKDMMGDFRRKQGGEHSPLKMNGGSITESGGICRAGDQPPPPPPTSTMWDDSAPPWLWA